MKTDIKLLPCPFCGGPVELENVLSTHDPIHGTRKWWGITCRNQSNRGGSCAIEIRPSASEEAAIARWNMRKADTGETISNYLERAAKLVEELTIDEDEHKYVKGNQAWELDRAAVLIRALRFAAPPPTKQVGEHSIVIDGITLTATGPQGCGKTRLLEQIKQLDRLNVLKDTPHPIKAEPITKQWCENMAELEESAGDPAIGVGVLPQQGEGTKPREEFLALAKSAGARITGKPDGSEPIEVVFSIDSWRKFDASVLSQVGEAKRCEYCDDTGDVHDQTGEWRGSCSCPAGLGEAKAVAYIDRKDLAALQACKHMRVGLDSPSVWPMGVGESKPYDWLVPLYAAPAAQALPVAAESADRKIQRLEAALKIALNPICPADHAGESSYANGWNDLKKFVNECQAERRDAAIAAIQGENYDQDKKGIQIPKS